MNREKRNAPKPKRFCTTSSSDETLSRGKDRPRFRMPDALMKIKMDLMKRTQVANNLIQERQTSKMDTVDDFRRKKFKQTSRTDMMDDSGHVSRADTLDDSSRHTSRTDTMDDCSLQTTQVRSPFYLQTQGIIVHKRM